MKCNVETIIFRIHVDIKITRYSKYLSELSTNQIKCLRNQIETLNKGQVEIIKPFFLSFSIRVYKTKSQAFKLIKKSLWLINKV